MGREGHFVPESPLGRARPTGFCSCRHRWATGVQGLSAWHRGRLARCPGRKRDLVSRALAKVYVDDQLALGRMPGYVTFAGPVFRQHDAASAEPANVAIT